ncbi:DEAD/DEAH box helicase [bacterium]|nr:DEAD/DEAH box helicase [bacterium]MBU1065050.1 DEAD/DEAH box helicase [bacterium]MBU1634707.1 DEAD/DEAH box helicase [bacterium]MBU1874786.1 DEAD/DEAH box helicase [bacterium]
MNPVETLLDSKDLKENIAYVFKIEGSEGKFSPFPEDLLPEIKTVLEQRGITQLYSHQAEAWTYATNHQDFTVVTPTASGKTLTYNLPVLQEMINNPGSKALYLFPTKALSQDQMNEAHDFITLLGKDIKVFTFDGDTPANARQAIRKQGNIVVTNPDMLHQGIMPHHTKWMQFFQNLKFVVIDEMHTYRGVFGSHFTNVMRRFRRLCEFYRSDPLFILCSATIANPQEHAEKLIEKPVRLIEKSGAPVSPKTLYFYNPPIVNKELGIRASYIKQTRYLANRFIKANIQTIIFALSRLNVEVLTKYLKDDFESDRESMSQPEKIAGYRGGYLPNRRREIEKGVRNGTIKGVVSTNALELGIDIGSLDATILAGYPGSISSTWQQIGRAGRRGKKAYGIFIARSSPVDQFLMQYPEYFFSKNPEHARINPDNLMILVDHIKCASFELPFEVDESFGHVKWDDLKEVLTFLVEGGILHRSGDRWYWSEDVYPAADVNLRRIPEGNFVVVDTDKQNKIIAEVDYSAAAMTIYPDAIYMASGEEYIVDELDWDGRKAFVRKSDSDYYTDSIDYTNVKVLSDDEQRESTAVDVFKGEVQVVTRVVGYKKIKFYSMENVGYGKINLPDLEMATTAYWFTIPEHLLKRVNHSRADIIDGIMGISTALHSVATLKIMSESHDIHRAVGDKSSEWFAMNTITERGIYTPATKDIPSVKLNPDELTKFQPTIFIYDNYPGGIGFTPLLFDSHEELIENTYRLIKSCVCKDGCPSCVGPSKEVGKNSKQTAIDILSILGNSINGF